MLLYSLIYLALEAFMTEGFIAPHGGYRKLLSYRKAEMVYDATACFCKRFLKKYDRTYDQMIQKQWPI
jgi:hypothetical protein